MVERELLLQHGHERAMNALAELETMLRIP